MKNILLFFFLTALTLTANTQSLIEAINKTNNERFPEAIRDFKSLIATSPADGLAYYNLGNCYFKKGEVDSAVSIWNKGFDMAPTNHLSLVGKFRALWMNGDKVGAQAQLTKARELTKGKKLKPLRAEVLRGAAEGYIKSQTKDLDAALTLLTEAIEIQPNNEENYLLQGDALYEQAKKIAQTNNTTLNASDAIKSYNKVLDINPKSPRGKLRVANIYQAADNETEANSIYKEAVAIDSTFAPAYRERAEMLMRFNKMKLAIQDWRKYLALNNNLEALYRYGSALYVAKEYCEAINVILEVNKRGIVNLFTERILAKSYLECKGVSNGPELGMAASERFFQLADTAKDVSYLDIKTKGDLLMKLGKDSLGIMEWEKATKMNQDIFKELTGDIAKMYFKMKKYDKAIETYLARQGVIELTVQEWFNLGQSYVYGPKNYNEADTVFAKVSSMSPSYTPAYFFRARCKLKLDANNALWLARPYYAKVLELVTGDERKKDSNKKMVIEAAKYLGGYYGASLEKDPAKVKEYFQIVYDLDPNDAQAKQVLGIK